MGNWAKNRLLESGSTSVVIPAGNSADRPDEPVFGQFRFNTDTARLEVFIGMPAGFVPLAFQDGVTYTVDSFVGDGITTVFTMSEQESQVTQIMVFIGSIYQNPSATQPGGATYTLNGGFDITFTSAPPAGEPITVIHSTS